MCEGIIETDDIAILSLEIEKALNYCKKCNMLVESVKRKDTLVHVQVVSVTCWESQKFLIAKNIHFTTSWLLAAWHSGRTPVFDWRTFPVPRSTYSWRVTIYVGKPSAIGQPTRLTQPFILSGLINWVVTNFIGYVLVAPSGECSRGWAGAVVNRYAPCVAALWPA